MKKTVAKTALTNIAALLAVLLSGCATGSRSLARPTLKNACKKSFLVGVAINRAIATGAAVRADNVNRHQEQVENDIALFKAQFNQISPENDLKWALGFECYE